MREGDPALFRDQFHQILFDAFRIGVFGEPEALRDALDVGIDDHSGGDSEGRAENHVGRFAGGARDGEERVDVARDLAAEIGENFAGGADHRFGFVVEEAGGADVPGELGLVRRGEIADGGVFAEQRRRHHVDALVGALRRENGGDQQLPRAVVVERAGGVGISLVENGEDVRGAFLGCGRFCHT